MSDEMKCPKCGDAIDIAIDDLAGLSYQDGAWWHLRCYLDELHRQLAAMTVERDRLRAIVDEISVVAYASFADDAEEIRETGSAFHQGRMSMADTITRILEDREAAEAEKEKP